MRGGPAMAHSYDLTSQEVASHEGKEHHRHTIVETCGDVACEREGDGLQQGDIECHLGNDARDSV